MERFGKKPKKKTSKWDLALLNSDAQSASSSSSSIPLRHDLPRSSSIPSPPASPSYIGTLASGDPNHLEFPCFIIPLGILKVLASVSLMAILVNFFSVTFHEAHKTPLSTRPSRSIREASWGEGNDLPTNIVFRPLATLASRQFEPILTPRAGKPEYLRRSLKRKQISAATWLNQPTDQSAKGSLSSSNLRGMTWGGGINKHIDSRASTQLLSYGSQHPFTLDPAALNNLRAAASQNSTKPAVTPQPKPEVKPQPKPTVKPQSPPPPCRPAADKSLLQDPKAQAQNATSSPQVLQGTNSSSTEPSQKVPGVNLQTDPGKAASANTTNTDLRPCPPSVSSS